MLSFEEKMALLDKELAAETSESLLKKLQQFPACGPTLEEFASNDPLLVFEKYGYRITQNSPLQVEKGDTLVSGVFIQTLFELLNEYQKMNIAELPVLSELNETDKKWLVDHLFMKSYDSPVKFSIEYNENDVIKNDGFLLFHFVKERE